MQEETFNLQTVTPLFLTGAYETSAELRPPSFRGQMRYWLRTLLGGLTGTGAEGLKQVVAIEEQVFGSTEMGSGVMVWIAQRDFPVEEFRRESRGRDVTGRDYLFWSMNRSGSVEKRNLKPARKYIREGTSFQLTLASRNGNKQALERGVAALWLLTNLGGVGSRARRGAGSLQITGQFPAPFSFAIPRTPEELARQLTAGIRQAREICKSSQEGVQKLNLGVVHKPNFDVLTADHARIWILRHGDAYASVDEALRDIGGSLQDYRRSISPLAKRRIFGLPLGDRNRVASPLQLRITKLQNGRYVGVAVLFKTHLPLLNAEDYAMIEAWIKEDFPQAIRVEL